jgi:hypothetical protein
MPISRKRFSKKRTPKKSVKKNTRKHKKRTSRRKYKKSGKRFRFFGGFGEDENCIMCEEPMTPNTTFETNCHHNFHRACIEQWCNGKAVCPCPICRTPLDPNPNPNPVVALPQVEQPMENLYRVQFFTFVNNPQTGEIDRVPVSVQDIPDPEINILEDYFIGQIHGLTPVNILFFGEEAGVNPNGYITLGENPNNVVVNEGEMDVIDPAMPINIQSVTITRVPNFNV